MKALLAALLLWCGCLPLSGRADELRVDARLAPGEQYRRLSLVLLIGEGAGAALSGILPAADAPARETEEVDPDRLKSPLIRIVDQDSLLTGTAWLFRLAHEHGAAIAGRIRDLVARYPEAVGAVSAAAVREDAVLVRTAVADAIEYAGLARSPAALAALAAYRERTLQLRNLMEYEQFDQELRRITEDAIASVGGKLDAYQRMFDDEVQDQAFDQHIRAAEHPYSGRRPFDEDAGKIAEEVMESVVLAESQPDL